MPTRAFIPHLGGVDSRGGFRKVLQTASLLLRGAGARLESTNGIQGTTLSQTSNYFADSNAARALSP